MTCPQTLKTFQLTVTSGNILRVTGFKCRVVDPSFCYYERCDIKAINRNVKDFNVVVRLLQKPVNNVTVRLEIVRRLAASTQPIYQFEIDGCQFMHDIIISHLELQKELGAGIMIGKGDYVINANWLAYNVLRFITTATLEVTD
ncbi:uncharacterized protein LOC133840663 isoform X2 [Drosophila sulfurigaster albostrigata]|uniref:uncharacterized protein LOC133840663 isoform X2 n=1 Tax=Drosophila sulfurigaster albostrigata TaxID=89887 RepID=UPI002D2196F0|nr:uncharacterized protein LOC133840663 isoform X2 [Drosophila sulfurigaster albostrigata]